MNLNAVSETLFNIFSSTDSYSLSFLVNVEHVELTAVNQTIGPYKLGKKSSKRDEYLRLPLTDLHLSWWTDYLGAERRVNEVESPQVFLKPEITEGKPCEKWFLKHCHQHIQPITYYTNSEFLWRTYLWKDYCLNKNNKPIRKGAKVHFLRTSKSRWIESNGAATSKPHAVVQNTQMDRDLDGQKQRGVQKAQGTC